MKVQHESYANQKLSTQWGDIMCDANGVADVAGLHKDACSFLTGILKFQPVSGGKKVEAPKVEEKAEEAKEEKAEESVDSPASRFEAKRAKRGVKQ